MEVFILPKIIFLLLTMWKDKEYIMKKEKEMKVWVISRGNGEDYEIEEVCSSKESAERTIQILQSLNRDNINEPEEWETDSLKSPKRVWFFIYKNSNDALIQWPYDHASYQERKTNGGWCVCVNYQSSFEKMKHLALIRRDRLQKERGERND